MSHPLNYSDPATPAPRRALAIRFILRAAVVGAVLLCVPWTPFLVTRLYHTHRRIANALYFLRIENALYFLPQTAFPYEQLVWRDAGGSHAIFAHSAAVFFNVVQWVIIGIVLASVTMRLKLRLAVPILIVASV